MNKDNIRQALVVVATLLTLTVNGLANGLPINGLSTDQISDMFPVLFTPAGYVFAIWGLIYLGMVAYTVYQALPAQRENPVLRRIGYIYISSAVANSVWIFLWHYLQIPLTLLAMFTILVALIIIYLRLDIGRREVPAAERWLVHLPFSIYLGWISVATIANVSIVLYVVGWGGWGIAPAVWTVIMLAVAAGLGLAMSLTRADVGYLLVLVWAFVGINAAQSEVPLVATGALVAAGVAALLAIVSAVPGGPFPLGKGT
jgi:benzodiazapine receptor